MNDNTVHCYVGCHAGSPDLQALHVLECDTETGAAKIVQSVKGLQGTTYFQIHGGRLYTVVSEETPSGKRGVAVAFSLDGWRIGAMERLAVLPCESPCHVALSPDFRRMSFAAYLSATAGTLPIEGGAVSSVVHPDDAMGPNRGRQQKAYAHCTFHTPDGSRMGVIDLGCDRILFYDPETMRRDDALSIKCDPGDGPRHAIWSKDDRYLFVVNELGSSVASFAFDGKCFKRVGKWSMLPAGFSGQTKAAAIKLTSDGKVLMASNRGHDSIAFFDVDNASGSLSLRNIARLTGSFPRDFELMPGEKFMVVGHKMSNEIQVYRFDRCLCTIEPIGAPISVWRPLCFKYGVGDEVPVAGVPQDGRDGDALKRAWRAAAGGSSALQGEALHEELRPLRKRTVALGAQR